MRNSLKTYMSILLLSTLTLLVGCQSQEEKQAIEFVTSNTNLTKKVEDKIAKLEENVSNPNKKGQYELIANIAVNTVKKEHFNNEAIQDLLRSFEKDMTVSGTPFTSLKKDVNEVLNHEARSYNGRTSFSDMNSNQLSKIKNYNNELRRVSSAIDDYDDRFIDYVNSLAAISNSINPIIVQESSKEASFGSQFVGNPNYGQWVTDNSGNSHWSFWETYGMISFIDDMLFDGGRHYGSYGYNSYRSYGNDGYYSNRYRYDSWHNNRNYSYYNDTYSKKYESPKTVVKTKSVETKLNKKYSSNLVTKTNVSKQTSKIKNSKFTSNLVRNNNTSGKGMNSPSGSGYKSGGSVKKFSSPSINKGK